MKKILCIILVLALALSAACFGEEEVACYKIFSAGSELTDDFDGDGKTEKMRLVTNLDEYMDGSFTLTVGSFSVSEDYCCMLDDTVYAMRVGTQDYYYGTLFFVQEYGPSDDPLSYCYFYTEGELIEVGMIPSLAEYFEVDSDGVITCSVRASMIGTWSRKADYMLASGYSFANDEFNVFYYICEVPRSIYAMGMIVTLKTDVSVYDSPYSQTAGKKISGNQKLILAATDDASVLYVTSFSGEEKGWLKIKQVDYMDYVEVNGKYLPVDEVFDDILYAD